MVTTLCTVLTWALVGQGTCPAARNVPYLKIDEIRDTAFPVEDVWQVFFDDTPISDMQLAMLAGDADSIEGLRDELRMRGPLTYTGMAVAAAGTAVSSLGWALLGGIEQNKLSQTTALSLALGGLVVGLAGVLLVTDAVQSTVEPHVAPSPRHRLSRDEVHRLIGLVNRRWATEICAGTEPMSLPLPSR